MKKIQRILLWRHVAASFEVEGNAVTASIFGFFENFERIWKLASSLCIINGHRREGKNHASSPLDLFGVGRSNEPAAIEVCKFRRVSLSSMLS